MTVENLKDFLDKLIEEDKGDYKIVIQDGIDWRALSLWVICVDENHKEILL